METFYQHCYDVFIQIQDTFSVYKRTNLGIKKIILDFIEQKMVSDIRDGIHKVLEAYPLPQDNLLPKP